MTGDTFRGKVSAGGIVPLSRSEWETIAPEFTVLERHPTQLAGDLLIVDVDGVPVAVEAPSRDARVARPLGGAETIRTFVAKRMEEYERMWDGCGVKIDYLGPDPSD